MKKFSSINESKSKFSIGLDVHGVIDALPEFFSFLTDSFVKNGAEVHIITGGEWSEKLEQQLSGIKYTHKFSVYDHLLKTAETLGEIQFPDGTIQKKFDDKLWDSTKAQYCKDNNISLHIDDTLVYNEYFSTPFCRLWSHNGKQKASHKDIRHLD